MVKGKNMKTITSFIYAAFAAVSAIGAVTTNAAPGDLFASVNGDGLNGGGFILQLTPTGAKSIFVSGRLAPVELALNARAI
jgi:hypothetical protein